ncbi:antibiotic biosynthesis monooxygenase [Streptomyces sp. NBC_01275]|uniref:antibiotic biosynthesis monooxygenase family protein n=1 Tax=Streptomyces sp. NBC_01275 TaxID=2903807 RepID=UPI0022574B83|nr:antibiotic biosynthesis monooxygenase family protein [Streptomyces sp. NBC_01275]MCX4766676.1 antibiotic biosynthesis monooxygenase [Streptomyces sp. NBC_01275]
MTDHEPDAEGAGTVTFVNTFTVHAEPEVFEKEFARTSEFMARQPGFVRHTLSQHAERPGEYVNVAEWRDLAAFRAAVSHTDFAPHAGALRALAESRPELYAARLHRAAAAAPRRDAT